MRGRGGGGGSPRRTGQFRAGSGRRRARVAELPGACHVCALMLVSSPHLARSYHHLFPVPPFTEVPPPQVAELAAVRSVGGFPVPPVLPRFHSGPSGPTKSRRRCRKDSCKGATCMSA